MKLDLHNFQKAVSSLKEALEVSINLSVGNIINPEEKVLRAGVT
jgi:hypothetical protein